MKKYDVLKAEINEILSRPTPWGPMIIPRIQAALRQSLNTMEMMDETISDLQDKMKFYDNIRTDTKLQRNIEIMKRAEKGESQAKMAKEFGMSKQRINKICHMTRKHLEKSNETQTEGLSREGNSISA